MAYADNGDELRAGDRVELHPATDRWMMGDRYGVVTKVGRIRVTVKLDRSGRTLAFDPQDIQGRVF